MHKQNSLHLLRAFLSLWSWQQFFWLGAAARQHRLMKLPQSLKAR
jgi:hypothetical protein